MAEPYDVIVIGVGAMGSAACYFLAKRGVRVLGLEQFAIPNERASHHGMSRMIRMAYFEHPDYVELLARAFENWRSIEQESDCKLLHCTGGLYMGYEDGALVSGSLQAARKHKLAHELLDRDALRQRYPQFELQHGMIAFIEQEAGYVRSTPAVAAYVEQAIRHSAHVHEHEAVQSWSVDGDGVRVTTTKRVYRAERLIVTAGAWTPDVLEALKPKLSVTRQTIAWFQPQDPSVFFYPRCISWALDPSHSDAYAGIYYGFPLMEDEPGFKIAHHWPGAETHPDRVLRSVNGADEKPLREALARYVPSANGELLRMTTCLYCSSPDHHFIVDRHPGAAGERVFLACGFSGHGFKFASVIGEVLADFACNGQTDLPVGFLNLARFAT